ncbi:hypothetical protein [Bacillus sp. OTU530]|uniref:hypothetical protein n=1 Tax=Bacillus sp. OTU530 TaxID=3043862 RepID=UPI00313C1F12
MMKKISGYGYWIVLVIVAVAPLQSIYQWITNRQNFKTPDYLSLGFGVVGFLAMFYLIVVMQKAKKKQM